MKLFIYIAALAVSTSASIAAQPAFSTATLLANEIHHGGGCRKDSPQGQCCHAGSKPYHCH